MKKFLFLAFSTLALAAMTGCNNDDNSFKVNAVPATQNNTVGAACAEGFVEHCNGSKLVYCGFASAEDVIAGKATVVEEDCAEYNGDGEEFTCAITLNDQNKNYTECVGKNSEDLCDTLNAKDKDCGYDPEEGWYEYEYEYTCKQFDDGKKHWIATGGSYCSGICGNGCNQVTCTPNSEDSCSADKKYTQECVEMEDGSSIYIAIDCNSIQSSCIVEEGWADCE